ncbi:unnamed protein product, partial [Cochlearia groenlandica]
SKGSIGHAFTVRIRTENQNQTSFYPFVPHEISVLVELILGHLRYLLTDVPPQPNSPPDNSPKEPFPVRPPAGTQQSAIATKAARAVCQQPTGLELGPPSPVLRANPFPEVTDPFCRLPLPTLFHRPEVSAQLGTVTRLPVHPASPVLLTKNGPLGALDSAGRLNKAAAPSYLFK